MFVLASKYIYTPLDVANNMLTGDSYNTDKGASAGNFVEKTISSQPAKDMIPHQQSLPRKLTHTNRFEDFVLRSGSYHNDKAYFGFGPIAVISDYWSFMGEV